jgi:hypothetical protein
VAIVAMTTLNEYFAVVYFHKTNVESVGPSARSARCVVTVTVLGIQRMIFSFVTGALIIKIMAAT